MNVQELLGTISERVSATASVKQVYGDPVTAGNRTVIPVASVQYGFGAGGGKAEAAENHKGGGGGGGGVKVKPCGALEITPQGTRFVPFAQPKDVVIAFGLGAALGILMASLTGTKRIEVVKAERGSRGR